MNKYLLMSMIWGTAIFAQAAEDIHAGHGHAAEAEKGAPKAKPAVEILTAEGGPVERLVTFPAEIRLNRDRTAAVSPRYAGIIRSTQVNPGDTVKKGDVLATMENHVTLASYDLIAPLSGTVIAKNKSAGESAAEDAVLFEIADLSSVWVDISIFPQYGNAVRTGQRVELIAPDGDSVETVIQYISPLISPETRTLQARCLVSHPDFKPGAFVSTRIAVESVQAVVRVEKEALQTLNGRAMLFIQDAHGLEPRDVETGLKGAQFVEIKAGLQPGEKYVGYGSFDLKANSITSGLDAHAGHGH